MSDGPWWPQPVATALSILAGAATVAWQRRSASQADLKLKLFDKLRDALDAASAAVIASGIYAFAAPDNIRSSREMMAKGVRAAAINRIPKFNELHFEALNKTTALISTLEGYEIVSAHFELFRRALGCASSDVRNAFTQLTPTLFRTFPVDVPNILEPHIPAAADADVAELTIGCTKYWEKAQTLSTYIHDIKIEAQNALLGGIFRRRVPPRKPADPRLWVLRTNDPDYLLLVRKYFLRSIR